jgi:hypothetical protein
MWSEIGSKITDLDTWLAFQLISTQQYRASRFNNLYQDKIVELRPEYNERMNWLLDLTYTPSTMDLIALGENMEKGCPYHPIK